MFLHEDDRRHDLLPIDETIIIEDDYHCARKKLLATVQGQWFNESHVAHKPASDDRSANIAFSW